MASFIERTPMRQARRYCHMHVPLRFGVAHPLARLLEDMYVAGNNEARLDD